MSGSVVGTISGKGGLVPRSAAIAQSSAWSYIPPISHLHIWSRLSGSPFLLLLFSSVPPCSAISCCMWLLLSVALAPFQEQLLLVPNPSRPMHTASMISSFFCFSNSYAGWSLPSWLYLQPRHPHFLILGVLQGHYEPCLANLFTLFHHGCQGEL